ncbi:MAG TPA: phosphoribosyltransferase family protein [Rhodocyclaceae bacterium]|nr:phosphoribosyltransferase family protein [Rhodocyclaceae bacterium]
MDRLVHTLKYEGRLSLAEWFGCRLAPLLEGLPFDRIIPMPLHPDRLRERGFNQATEIARTVGRILRIPVDIDRCRRWRPSLPQARLPLDARAANVRGIFECIADLSEQRLLLLDDVMTSGATLNECARILKLHGAATVDVAAVARAVRN